MGGIRVLGDRNPDYPTHRGIDDALPHLDCEARWMPTDAAEAGSLDGVDGLWVAPGSPYRNDDAVLLALRAAREQQIPLLATCGGFQYALLELARNLAGIAGAVHAEVAPEGRELVLAPLACALVGRRSPVRAVAGTRLAALVGTETFPGYHWCSYGLDPAYLPRLREAGLVENAHGDVGLEGFELRDHPFYMATAFQPQMDTTREGRLHPLLTAFARAALAQGQLRKS